MALADDLATARREARERADLLVRAAADEERDLTAEEMTQYTDAIGEANEAGDRLEQERDREVRELRAAVARQPEEPAGLGELLTRAISEASGLGAATTPSEFSASFWDHLAASAVGLQSGFTVVSTERDSLVLPRVTSDTAAAWTTEGNAITPNDATGDTVTATPRKLAGIQVVSNETLADSSPSVAQIIAAGLVRSVALKADAGFFYGSGVAPEIRGLRYTSGIQTNTAGGTPSNLDFIANAIEALEDEDARATAIVMAPEMWGDVIRLKEATTSNKALMQDSSGSGSQAVQRSIYGVPVFTSSQIIPSDVFVYDAAQVVVVRRQDVRVEQDSSRLFNSDQSEIRAIARLDLVVPNPKAVYVATNFNVT